ncbi:hypothetical protein BpHYR1_005506 [Brachionus plicatilis]|uniref:BEN domain-containing protein n=1 Tax=Brachionus plicatilis TaxID=10195 RepID=A0A3M7Q763_BRAPC|nr:hypothetical protein BpHYR1_005506 [Brachionus plicatilis]
MGKEALNAKIHKETSLLKLDPPIRKPIQVQSIIEKPKALQTSLSLLKMSQFNSNHFSQYENNPIVDKLDVLISFCNELSAGQAEIKRKLSEIDQTLRTITGKAYIEPIEDSQSMETSIFSKEIIEQAKSRLSVDLQVDLVFNGKNLLRHPFNYTNINTFGTTLLSELFKLRELNSGTVEPTKSTTPSLDQKRVDLIKVCYLKKLKTIDAFEHYWPSIVKSLRQKCIDVKSNIKKKGHLWYKLQEELVNDGFLITENGIGSSQDGNYVTMDNYCENQDLNEFENVTEDETEQMEELGLA